MAYLLAIEAASDSCSVALLDSQSNSTIQRLEPAPRMHSKLLYPMLNELMAEAGVKPINLDAVVFGKGPGSFTGLRIAAATAQGIGYANDIPLIGISTLQAMAQQALAENGTEKVFSIMDARMNELYLGCYEEHQGLMKGVMPDQIGPIAISVEHLQRPAELTLKPMLAVGHGLKLYDQFDDSLKDLCEKQDSEQVLEAKYLLPLAQNLFESGKTLQPDEVELVYLREQTHWKTIKEQKALREQNQK